MKINLGRIAAWLLGRAKERSTYTGLAIIAGVLGAPAIGAQINQIGEVVGLLVGGGLMAATTL